MKIEKKWRIWMVVAFSTVLAGCDALWEGFLMFDDLTRPGFSIVVASSRPGEKIHAIQNIKVNEGSYRFYFLMPSHDCKKQAHARISIKVSSEGKTIFQGADNFSNMVFAMQGKPHKRDYSQIKDNAAFNAAIIQDYAQEDDDEVLEAALSQVMQGVRPVYVKGTFVYFSRNGDDSAAARTRVREKLRLMIARQNAKECVGIGFFTDEHNSNSMEFDVKKGHDTLSIKVDCDECDSITDTPIEIWMNDDTPSAYRRWHKRLCEMKKVSKADCGNPSGF